MNFQIELPQNIQLEVQVLGHCLHLNKKPSDYNLLENDFYHVQHQKIFNCLENGATLLELFDTDYIKANKLIDSFSHNVCMASPNSFADLSHIQALRRLGFRRRGILGSVNDLKRLEDLTEEIDLEEENSEDYILTSKELSESVPGQWRSIKPIRMRFKDLEKRLYSFNKGEVCGVIGRSGVGKTAFGIQFGQTIAESQNEDFLFWSGEMSASALVKRIAMIDFYALNQDATAPESGRWFFNNLKNNENFALNHIISNMTIIDKSCKWKQLRALIEKAVIKNPKIGTIVLDYLQLIGTDNKDRRVEVGQIAKDLKTMAKELNIRVIPLIQTTRDGADGYEPVKMHHCKESGEIEEALDSGIGLWKDENQNLINLDIVKSRENGGGGQFQMKRCGVFFTDNFTPFEEIGIK